jgi:hypothetical protein
MTALIGIAFQYYKERSQMPISIVRGDVLPSDRFALDVLSELEVKGRGQPNDYERSEFGSGWATVAGCDMRNRILARDLIEVNKADGGCTVLNGRLQDPYTAKEIIFKRGNQTSDDVQIDHVVALSDAWQKGARTMTFDSRVRFANDPLNLLAVDGPTNVQKGGSDAASWLPPNKAYRCQYVARQVLVKYTYGLWVTMAEKDAITRVLNTCKDQLVPRIQ